MVEAAGSAAAPMAKRNRVRRRSFTAFLQGFLRYQRRPPVQGTAASWKCNSRLRLRQAVRKGLEPMERAVLKITELLRLAGLKCVFYRLRLAEHEMDSDQD